MPGLGETTAALRRLRKAATTADLSLRPGFQETSAHGANPGDLKMLIYSPETLKAGAPLLVLLHGCAQSGTGFATSGGWTQLAERLSCILLVPEQSSNNNFNRCFNWFAPADTQRDAGEAASIANMVRQATKTFASDPKRVFVAGLSAGGAMTCALLAAYPELFAAGGVVAGLPYGVARSLPDAMRNMHRADAWTASQLGDLVRQASPGAQRRPRLAIWHGDSDWTVDRANGLGVAKQWANALGLSELPDETAEFAKFSRSIWREAGSNDVLIEFNLVYDFGHGAPLSTLGPAGVGAAAPFMMEAGVSSTLEMARFWGLDQSATSRAAPGRQASKPVPKVREPRRAAASAAAAESGVGRQVLSSLAKVVPEDVTEVIAKAFKSAGLLKK